MKYTSASFPTTRLRRNRNAPWKRVMLRETNIIVHDLIWPAFVQEGKGRTPIDAMPGVERLSIPELVKEVKRAYSLGISAVALFPVVPQKKKSEDAKEALNPKNLVCEAIRAIKKEVPHVGIFADVALDPYTTHGHDGVVKNGDVANDETIALLAKQAVVLAKAGADMVAPLDMMDGRVGAIRAALDKAGCEDVGILSYAAKYASSFYGPFREAVGSDVNLGKAGKQSYQMDPANAREALREVKLDIEEGADMVMVKPALPYLDVIKSVTEVTSVPVLAYQVSGEYAMIKAGAKLGWINEHAAMLESLIAIKRAGATAILTYAAVEVAGWLQAHAKTGKTP